MSRFRFSGRCPEKTSQSDQAGGGMALRFARVEGYRSDKRPGEADTIDSVRAIHAGTAE